MSFSFEDLMNDLMHDIHQNASDHGFWEGENKAEKIALMHSELSEALEAIRHGDPESTKIPGWSNEVEELADAVIRCMDYCAHFGLDLPGAIVAKHQYNKGRPFKHGKAF